MKAFHPVLFTSVKSIVIKTQETLMCVTSITRNKANKYLMYFTHPVH